MLCAACCIACKPSPPTFQQLTPFPCQRVHYCHPVPEQLPQWQVGLLQAGVALRTRLLRLPFGDQALFVRREVLQQLHGFHEHELLEDVDLVKRLNRCVSCRLACAGLGRASAGIIKVGRAGAPTLGMSPTRPTTPPQAVTTHHH